MFNTLNVFLTDMNEKRYRKKRGYRRYRPIQFLPEILPDWGVIAINAKQEFGFRKQINKVRYNMWWEKQIEKITYDRRTYFMLVFPEMTTDVMRPPSNVKWERLTYWGSVFGPYVSEVDGVYFQPGFDNSGRKLRGFKEQKLEFDRTIFSMPENAKYAGWRIDNRTDLIQRFTIERMLKTNGRR